MGLRKEKQDKDVSFKKNASTTQKSTQNESLPRFTSTFQKNDPNPEHRFNKHFSQKYEESLPLIKQIQYEKDQVNTPFVNAQKSLRYILQSELKNGLIPADAASAQATKSKNNRNSKQQLGPRYQQNQHNFYDTENSFNSPPYENSNLSEPFLMDLTKIGELEEKLQWIVDFVMKGEEVGYPSFQGYWEVLFELRLEKLHTLFKDGQWKENIDFALLLNIASVALFQCLSLKLHECPQLMSQVFFQKIHNDIKNILELVFQTLMILISQILNKVPQESQNNVWYTSLEKMIFMKKIKNSQKNDDLFDMKRNNQLAETYLKTVLKSLQRQFLLENKDLDKIKPIFSVINHSLRERPNLPLIKLRENIINGTFLSIKQDNVKEDSIMKTIYHPVDIHGGYSPLDLIGLPPGEEQVLEVPFLPPRNAEDLKAKPYTLVLDLDETLGHYDSEKHTFFQRPFLLEFLESMYQKYELVIFTAGLKDYADSIIPQFDSKNLISYRLYRQHCNLQGLVHIKDLNSLGRDLSKTIILDNNQYNFQYQTENAIFVTTWYSDMADTELLDLKKVLIKLADSKPTDVRWAMQKYRDHIIRQISSGVKNPFGTL